MKCRVRVSRPLISGEGSQMCGDKATVIAHLITQQTQNDEKCWFKVGPPSTTLDQH